MRKPNHLISEKSPYLLQHAYNPVEWYPWGDEAIERARKENKPILLSIGYSTCHWCHVMEKESFSNSEIAKVMNENLVCIKLDREERPDIDKVYMAAVTAMTGSGGWPLNMFLTPDLKPFYGGTYFPPEDRWGRIGWANLIRQIHEAWVEPEAREKIAQSAQEIAKHLQSGLGQAAGNGELSEKIPDEAFQALLTAYDGDAGGFGGAPKFPMPVYHNFLQTYYAARKRKMPEEAQRALQASLHTLRKMAEGGIYDQIGGGFHRYSTDALWRVPHFEKMLYDNAQLAASYLNAYAAGRDAFFARIARETLDYILRDMTHAQGGFFSAEDADSLPPELAGKVSDLTHEHKTEGAFYVWDQREIEDILGQEAGEIFCYFFGAAQNGNVESDPHGEFKGKNVLYAARGLKETSEKFGMPEDKIEEILRESKNKLFERRRARPRPHLDDKIIASWNGLAISVFAKAYQILADEKYLRAAQNAAQFVWSELYDEANRRLYRRWREGERKVNGISDDYAFLAQGFIDLYEAGFDRTWIKRAVQLMEDLNLRFLDKEKGGFYMTESDHDPYLLVRSKEDYDNVEPSANSIACLDLLRLSAMTGREDFHEWAEGTLKCFAQTLNDQPVSLLQMAAALESFIHPPAQMVILGDKGASDTLKIIEEIHSRWNPNKVLILIENKKAQEEISKGLPYLAACERIENKASAFVCVDRACRLPVADASILAKILDEIS